MQLSLKKAIFIISGLTIIGLGFFFSKYNIVQASLKEGQKFDDWSVSCTNDENKKQICLLNQQTQITKGDKIEILSAYQIGYIGKDKKLMMVQILPLGSMLQSGTTLLSDKKLLAPGKYSFCNAQGCQAFAELSKEDLKQIITGSSNFVSYINYEGKQVSVPLSNKGLKEAIDALNGN